MYQTLFPSPPPRHCQDAGRTIPTPPYLDLLAPGKASRKQLGYFSTKHRAIHRAFTIKNVGKKKTRCSPRTRILTRMLMVQMSKHMDMQSRRTLFCNSLFEQSCTYFPCYQSAVWSGKCRVWSVEWKV